MVLVLFLIQSLYILFTGKSSLEIFLCFFPPLQMAKYSKRKKVINDQCIIINVLPGTRISSRVLLEKSVRIMFHWIYEVVFF